MKESINEEMIGSLREIMEDDFPVLVETFLTDCAERIVDLNSAISSSNSVDVREISHGLKGSCSNLGADRLAEIGYVLETMGRTESLTGAEDELCKLEEEFKVVKEYFESM